MRMGALRRPPPADKLDYGMERAALAVLNYAKSKPARPLGVYLKQHGEYGHGLTDAELAFQGDVHGTELLRLLWNTMRAMQGTLPESEAVALARREERAAVLREVEEAARLAGSTMTVAVAAEVAGRTPPPPAPSEDLHMPAANTAPALLLSGLAYDTLQACAEAPLPRREVPPGVVQKLRSMGLVELVDLPSPYRMVRGNIPHMRLTVAGVHAARRTRRWMEDQAMWRKRA